jgi:signal peptidase I
MARVIFFIGVALFIDTCSFSSKMYDCQVKTRGMENTIKLGDLLLFEKKGRLSRNDFIIFCDTINFIYGLTTPDTGVCRIVGVPKDLIHIDKGIVFLNNQQINRPENAKKGYLIRLPDGMHYTDQMKLIDSYTGFGIAGNYAVINLDSEQYLKLSKLYTLINTDDYKKLDVEDTLFDFKMAIVVNQANYTPLLRIPAKGDTIILTAENEKYYKNGLKQFKKVDSSTYVSTDDMFFILGDSWDESVDSRYLGLINEKDIIARVRKLSFISSQH